MKRTLGIFVSVLVLGVILFMPKGYAADKIGYVNLGRIFDEYNKTKDQDKILEKKQKDFESERVVKVNEIKALQDKLGLLDEKQKAAKKTELEEKMKVFQEYEGKKIEGLRKERDDILKEILKDIEKAVRQYAEAQGYILVFNDKVLVYQAKDGDLTDKVVEIVNKNYQSPATK